MISRNFFKSKATNVKKYRLNQWIRVPEVMVIDDQGQQLGAMSTPQALNLAQEKGLDLVEVSPLAQPPVCRIMDYGKFLYQQTRHQHKTKKIETKCLRLSFKIGQHDLATKQKQAEKFLEQNHNVRIELRLRGREKAFRERAGEIIQQFIKTITVPYKMDKPIQYQMGTFSITISKK